MGDVLVPLLLRIPEDPSSITPKMPPSRPGWHLFRGNFHLKLSNPSKKKSELLSGFRHEDYYTLSDFRPTWPLCYPHKIPLKNKIFRENLEQLRFKCISSTPNPVVSAQNLSGKLLQSGWFACLSAEIREKISVCQFLPVNVQPSLEAQSKRKFWFLLNLIYIIYFFV